MVKAFPQFLICWKKNVTSPRQHSTSPLIPSFLLVASVFTFLDVSTVQSVSVSPPKSGQEGRFKVYQIRTSTVDQLTDLVRLEQNGIVDVWRRPMLLNATADVMVDVLEHGAEFKEFLDKFSLKSRLLIDDLSKFIAEKEAFVLRGGKKASSLLSLTKDYENESDDSKESGEEKKAGGKMLRDDPIGGRHSRQNNFGMPMGMHYNYPDMVAFMQRIVAAMPTQAQMRSIGFTYEGRSIQGIQFGTPSDKSRTVVWIDAGIHAREWTSIHTALYFIQLIANTMNTDRRLSAAMRSVDILIFPVLNPDGYEFTRQDPANVLFRMWRKNRSAERCSQTQLGERCCKGVDLNRNFDFKFAYAGTSYSPCSEIFHGDGPFSEIESRAVRDAIMSSDLRGRIGAFVSMHAYSQLFIYPYAHMRNAYPADVEDLKIVARNAVNAIHEKYGTSYLSGTGPETIYAYTGGSSDWAKETARIKYTYTIELRPSYWSWNGFVLSQELLIPTAIETWDGMLVVIEATAEMVARSRGGAPPANANIKISARSLASTLTAAANRQKQPENALPEDSEDAKGNAENGEKGTRENGGLADGGGSVEKPEKPLVAERPEKPLIIPALVEKSFLAQTEKPSPSEKPPFSTTTTFSSPPRTTPETPSTSTTTRTSTTTTAPTPVSRPKNKKCEDKQPHCREWIYRNRYLCRTARKTMEKECARTCQFCTP